MIILPLISLKSILIFGRKGGMPLMTLEYVLKKHGLEPGKDVEVRTDIQFDVMAGPLLVVKVTT